MGGGRGRECHDFSSKMFCLAVPKNFVGEPFCVSLISGVEKFYAYEGSSRFSTENCLSHRTEKLRRGTFLCFTKFLVSKNFMDRRGREEGGREYQVSMSKFYCVTVPKILVGEQFRASIISGIEKFYAYEWNITIFLGERSCVSQTFWYRKKLWIRGGGRKREGVSRIFVNSFWSHSAEKFR